jgi:hypothetical protein
MWLDSENKIALIFLPGRVLSQDKLLYSHMPKVKISSYYSRHHTIGVEDAIYYGFHCLNSQQTQQWTLFHETSCNFLKSLKPLLFLVEEILITVCWKVGLEMRFQLPSW